MGLNSVLASSQSQTDQLVEAYKATQQRSINILNDRRNLLQSRVSFYNTFSSRLNSLSSTIDKFKANDANDKFFAKTVSSSDATVATATAKSDAIIGPNSVKVERLASNDLLISNRLTLTNSFGEEAGAKTFEFTIGDTTKEVTVNFDGNETNEQAMRKIVQAINSTEDLDISASFVKDTAFSGRISFSSKNTGSENKILFNQSTVLDKLGLNPDTLMINTNDRTLSTDTNAGYRRADAETLDSRFELNSIVIIRGSNQITDAIDGLTINLLKEQEEEDKPVSFNTTVDTKSVESFVKSLLTSINDVMSNINSNRDARRNDSAVANLFQNLRNVALTKFNESSEDGLQYLVEAGIKFDNSGFLVISDSEKFKSALEKNPQNIADMFIGENGIAKQVEELIKPFVGSGGLVSERSRGLKSQIDLTSKRLTDTESRIDSQADNLRRQYQNYLKLFYEAQNQSSYMASFASSGLNSGF